MKQAKQSKPFNPSARVPQSENRQHAHASVLAYLGLPENHTLPSNPRFASTTNNNKFSNESAAPSERFLRFIREKYPVEIKQPHESKSTTGNSSLSSAPTSSHTSVLAYLGMTPKQPAKPSGIALPSSTQPVVQYSKDESTPISPPASEFNIKRKVATFVDDDPISGSEISDQDRTPGPTSTTSTNTSNTSTPAPAPNSFNRTWSGAAPTLP